MHRLLAVLPDADADTEAVLRSHHVPDHHWDSIRDEVKRVGGSTGLAVTIAKRVHSGGRIFDHRPNARADTPPAAAHRPLYDALENWIRNAGRYDIEAGVINEIAEQERRRGETLSDDQRARLVDLWRSMNPSGVDDPASQPGPGATAYDVQAQHARSVLQSPTTSGLTRPRLTLAELSGTERGLRR